LVNVSSHSGQATVTSHSSLKPPCRSSRTTAAAVVPVVKVSSTMNPPEIAFRTRRLVPEAGEHLFNGCSLAGHRLPRPGHRGGKIDRVRCASAIALRYGSACHAILLGGESTASIGPWTALANIAQYFCSLRR
jgi:hypothetical protein